MLIYATTEDLDEWPVQPAPANAEQLLRSASLMVRDATKLATYTVDEDGYPDVPTIRAAFRDATCAQVAAWAAAGIDPNTGAAGLGEAVAEKRIGTAAVRYETTRAQHRAALARGLCDDARRILDGEGLLATSPVDLDRL